MKIRSYSIDLRPICRRSFAFGWIWLGGSIVYPKKKSWNALSVVLNWMYFVRKWILRTFEDVICKAREELSTYRDILEISDRIKKVEPRQDFPNDRKDTPKAVSHFEKRGESIFFKKGRPHEASRSWEVGLRTSRTWSVVCATKRDIMRISVPKPKPKIPKIPKERKIEDSTIEVR